MNTFDGRSGCWGVTKQCPVRSGS